MGLQESLPIEQNYLFNIFLENIMLEGLSTTIILPSQLVEDYDDYDLQTTKIS